MRLLLFGHFSRIGTFLFRLRKRNVCGHTNKHFAQSIPSDRDLLLALKGFPVSGFRNRTRKRNQALKESFKETIRLKVFSYLLSLQKYPVRTNWNRSPTLAFFREGSALACSAVIRESGFR